MEKVSHQSTVELSRQRLFYWQVKALVPEAEPLMGSEGEAPQDPKLLKTGGQEGSLWGSCSPCPS